MRSIIRSIRSGKGGSSGSSPTITWNPLTASSTVRAIGPAISASRFNGITPARLVTGLITERGRCPATAEGLLGLFPEQRA